MWWNIKVTEMVLQMPLCLNIQPVLIEFTNFEKRGIIEDAKQCS